MEIVSHGVWEGACQVLMTVPGTQGSAASSYHQDLRFPDSKAEAGPLEASELGEAAHWARRASRHPLHKRGASS